MAHGLHLPAGRRSRKEAGHIAVTFHNEDGDIEFTPAALHVDGKLGVSKTIFGDDFASSRTRSTTNLPKLTIPSPSMVHYRGGKAAVDPAVYPTLDEFWADLTAAYREQVRRLGELGCTYLQVDDTSLAYMNDPHQRDYIASIGGDPERQHVEYIRHINEALAERPAGMSVTTHMCRGNFRSSWAAEGGYDFVAEALLNELEVDGFFMEWDDERSGGFEPLRFLPKGDKQVVLGLVTTKRGELESKDELKRRIEEASRYAPIEQLCLSPQCGFSSTVEGNELTEDEQWAKLAPDRRGRRRGLGILSRTVRDATFEVFRRRGPDDALLEPRLDRGAVPRRAARRPPVRPRAARGLGARDGDRLRARPRRARARARAHDRRASATPSAASRRRASTGRRS